MFNQIDKTTPTAVSLDGAAGRRRGDGRATGVDNDPVGRAVRVARTAVGQDQGGRIAAETCPGKLVKTVGIDLVIFGYIRQARRPGDMDRNGLARGQTGNLETDQTVRELITGGAAALVQAGVAAGTGLDFCQACPVS